MTIAQMTAGHRAAALAEAGAAVVVLEDLGCDEWSSFGCPYCFGPETD